MYYTEMNQESGGHDVYYNDVIIGWHDSYSGAWEIMQEHSAKRRVDESNQTG